MTDTLISSRTTGETRFLDAAGRAVASNLPAWPAGDQASWRRVLRGAAMLLNEIDRDLVRRDGVSLAEYSILVVIAEGPREGIRMTQLAELTMLSKSRLSHCADRLSDMGLLRRERVDGDKRGLLAVLTEEGRRRIVEMARTHFDDVREYTIDIWDEHETRAMAEYMDRCADAIGRKRAKAGRDGDASETSANH